MIMIFGCIVALYDLTLCVCVSVRLSCSMKDKMKDIFHTFYKFNFHILIRIGHMFYCFKPCVLEWNDCALIC